MVVGFVARPKDARGTLVERVDDVRQLVGINLVGPPALKRARQPIQFRREFALVRDRRKFA
jgi:hypothetical protein